MNERRKMILYLVALAVLGVVLIVSIANCGCQGNR